MKRNRKPALLLVLLVVCIGIQVAEQIHSARWEQTWHSLFVKADEFRKSIDKLEAEHAEPGKIAAQRKALGETMMEIGQAAHPHLLPAWLRGASSVGTLLIVVALWRMKRKPGGTEPAERGY